MASCPLVSIITTSYGHEAYLDDYVNGLLRQTYPNIELIFYDDGSPDNTWAKIQAYRTRLQARFPRLVVERHDNMGFLRELALAVEAAAGDYISILESDDYYYPEKVERTVRHFQEHPDVGVVHTDYDRLQDGHLLRRNQRAWRESVPTGDVLAELLKGNFLSTPTSCVRADLMKRHVDFRNFHDRGYLMGDYPMWLRLARVTRFGYIDEPLSVYRHLHESASRSRNPLRFHRFELSMLQIKRDALTEYGDPHGEREAVERRYHEQLYYGGFELNLFDECREGYGWLRRHDPIRYGYRRPSHFLRASAAIHPWVWAVVQSGQVGIRKVRRLLESRHSPRSA